MVSVFAEIVELVFFTGMLALRSDERVLSFHSEELCFFATATMVELCFSRQRKELYFSNTIGLDFLQ